MNWGDVQARWARTIVATLSAGGVVDAVVSPGSRSTPLVLALAHSALRVTPILDERAAAFFALGQARASGRPSVLVCTSGSAGAHYLPAVVEAREAGLPLIVLTADRPPELHGVSASQTTPQREMLASHALMTSDLGMPGDDARLLRSLATRVAHAAHTAWAAPGPVHVNVPFRKPFEPGDPSLLAADDEAYPTGPIAPPPRRVADDAAIAAGAALLGESAFGVVAAGPGAARRPGAADAIRRLAAATDCALLAEATSQLRDGATETSSGDGFVRIDAFDLALRSREARTRLGADVTVIIGDPPVSKSFAAWLAERGADARTIVIAEKAWPDPEFAADVLIVGDVEDTCVRLVRALQSAAHDDPVLETGAREADPRAELWRRADAAVWEAVLGVALAAEDSLSEATIARTVAINLADGGLLFLGNSLPVRDFDWFCQALPPHVGVVSQRGVAGIDGNIAGLIGLASCNRGRPTSAVIGDVTFLHDVGALQLAPLAGDDPIVLVVVNNDGGRIFERLPVATTPGSADTVERLFVMPHGRSPAAIAAGFGVATRTATTTDELSAALVEARETPGLTLIEAVVGPSRASHDAMFAAVDAAVRAALGSDRAVPAIAREDA